MTYAPDAVVYHAHDLDLPAFWKQQSNYGRGGYNYRRARRRRGAGALKPDVGLYLRILFHPFAAGGETLQRRLALAALLFASQIAVGTAFWLEWLRRAARSIGGD